MYKFQTHWNVFQVFVAVYLDNYALQLINTPTFEL